MRHKILASLGIVAGLLTGTRASAQPPPIPGETGTISPEGGGGDRMNDGVHTIVSGTADGILHLFRRPKKAAPQDGEVADPASTDALKDFKNGTRVVVHYAAEGDAAAHDVSGVVTRVDREAKTIRIRLADGAEEALQPAAATPEGDATADAADATVYYTDQNGRRVAHYFTRLSDANGRK